MSNLYVYTLFDHVTRLPRCTGIFDGGQVVLAELYRAGDRKSIADLFKQTKIIRNLILLANTQGRPVVLSDFKSHIQAFNIPRDTTHYNIYDLHLPDVRSTGKKQSDHALVRKILAKMVGAPTREYQRVMANAAVVYQDLEDKGLLVNYGLEKPVWSQKTFSGRSKTTKFNIQGYSNNDKIRSTAMPDDSILIHFDWICADIRVASLLSQDENLQVAFESSDPYMVMMEELNKGATTDLLTRDECKTYLLKSINSMDFTSAALSSVYPQLGDWIGRCKQTLSRDNGYLETLLKRRFRRAQAKNDLAVLNGVMQGSVAHAMQLSIRRIWEVIPQCLITEIHDSLVISAHPTSRGIKSAIDTVSEIMLHPFRGVLKTDPAFPLKVSVGKRWKKWHTMREYRESGITHVQQKKQDEGSAADQEEISGAEAEEEKAGREET